MGQRREGSAAGHGTLEPSWADERWAAGGLSEVQRWPFGQSASIPMGGSQFGAAMLDGLGRLVLLNTTFERVAGQRGEDLLGRSILDVLPTGSDATIAEVLEQVRTTSSMIVGDMVLDGQQCGLLITHLPGEPSRFTAQIFGTEAARQRRQVSTSSSAFELSFDQVALGMAMSGADGLIIRANEALKRMLGTDLGPGSEALGIVHPDDHPTLFERGAQALAGMIDGWHDETRLVRADGSTLWVTEVATLVRDEYGEPLHFLSQFVDITERKAAEAALVDSEHRVSFLAAELPVAVVEIDAVGTIVSGNQALCDLLDRNVVGSTLEDAVHPDDYDRLVATFRERGYRDSVLEFRIRRHDLVERWVRAHVRVRSDAQGTMIGSLATWIDITDEFTARAMSNQFGEVIETIEDMLAITDADGGLVYLNFAGRILLGDEERPLDGLSLADLFEAESAAEVRDVALSTARNFGSWKGVVTVIDQSFERLDLQLSIASHVSDTGEIYLSAMTRDITELKRAQRDLYQQATTDALTGLPNRAMFFDRLGHELARNVRHGGGLALLFVDLDRFKAVNDTMGHEAGDELLIQVAHRLEDCVRGSDIVARIGGDEFVILAEPILRLEDAQIIGERMVRAIGEPFQLSAGVANIGASIGLAMGDRSSTPRGLLREADLAAYQAKADGRSCLKVADSSR